MSPRDWDHYSDGRPIYYDRQGNPMTREQYASAKYESSDYRRIGLDTYPSLEDAIDPNNPLEPFEGEVLTVSTVWLGIDHGFFLVEPGQEYRPVIFETMIWGGEEYDTYCTRYCTEEEAREGHWRTMQDLRTGQVPWFLRDETADAEDR